MNILEIIIDNFLREQDKWFEKIIKQVFIELRQKENKDE